MHSFRRILGVSAAFVLICLILTGSLAWAFIESEYAYDEDRTLRRSLAGQVDLLIAGASQPQRAIIPSMLDESLGTYSYNLGGGWMNLIGDYRLLETELERNPVKDVFLAVSYATLTRTEASDDYEGDTYIVPRLETMQDKADYVLRCVDYRGYVSLYEYYVQQGWAYMLSAIRGEPVHNVNYDSKALRKFL